MYQFTETQKFRQWWIWLIFILAIGAGIISSFGLVKMKDEMDMVSYMQILVANVVPLVVALVFYFMKLDTRIDESGIYYRFFPVHFKERQISWDEIESARVKGYNPISEYGGWGLRYSFKNGRAINVSGDMGLQLVLKNGKKILIGTQKAEEMEMVLRDLGK